jgi:uncharacterized membrane protein YcgQ (UPF0703/DUF1980 family)
MAIISVRAAGDLPIISDYMPLIVMYFFLSQLFTFISFFWFATCNYYKSTGSLPKLLQKFAIFLIKMKRKIEGIFNNNIVTLLDRNTVKEKEIDTMISILNYSTLFIMTLTMFISYLTIWLIISN